jgi:hypothetical protein
MRLLVAQALSEIELAKAMAITDFFIVFLPIIELLTLLRDPIFPGDGAPVTIAATTIPPYRSDLATGPALRFNRAAAKNLPAGSFRR